MMTWWVMTDDELMTCDEKYKNERVLMNIWIESRTGFLEKCKYYEWLHFKDNTYL